MNDCVFCKIIAGELPSTLIYQDDKIIVIQDRAPKAPIHYLIIPKKHLKNIQEFNQEDYELGSSLIKVAQYLSQNTPDAADFNLVVNNGYNAGQRVFHVHVHFLVGCRLGLG